MKLKVRGRPCDDQCSLTLVRSSSESWIQFWKLQHCNFCLFVCVSNGELNNLLCCWCVKVAVKMWCFFMFLLFHLFNCSTGQTMSQNPRPSRGAIFYWQGVSKCE